MSDCNFDTPQDIPLNESVLVELFGEDPELHGILLSEFKDSCQGYHAEFSAAWDTHDAEGIKFAAHKLKSSSRTVGAEELADICNQLEKSAKAQDWPQTSLWYQQVFPAVDRVCQYIAVRE